MLVRYTGQGDLLENKANKIIAGFRLKYLPLILSISITIGALICYYVAAVIQHSIYPFPHNTITDSATDYPQNILFRMLVIPQMGGALLIILAEYYIFKYCAQTYKSRRIPSWWADFLSQNCTLPIMMTLCVVAIIMISIAIATIDQGYMNDTLHGTSAVIGFAGFYFAMIGITFNYSNLVQVHPGIISQKSLTAKKWLVNAMVAVIIFVIMNPEYMPFYHASQGTDEEPRYQPKYICILEYGIFFIEMAFFFTLYWDYEDLYFVFSIGQIEENDLKNIQLISGDSFQQKLIYSDEQEQQQLTQDQSVCLNQSQIQYDNNELQQQLSQQQQQSKYFTNGQQTNF